MKKQVEDEQLEVMESENFEEEDEWKDLVEVLTDDMWQNNNRAWE